MKSLIPARRAPLVVLATAILAWTSRGDEVPPPPPVRAEQAPEALRPRLALVGGIPVARLSGTAREIGRQHGGLFREQIRFLQREYFDAFAVKTLGREAIDEWSRQCEPFIPEDLREEMKGIAEGAGLPYADVLAANAVVDRLQNLMCSTLVASGEATKDGEVLFGRNLDFPGRDLLNRMTVVIVFAREGRVPVAAVTWPGLVGVLSGMNAEGVCGATMMIHSRSEVTAGIPYMMMYREALDQAHATADVRARIAKARRTCPNNFMVVDATGTAEVVEFDQERVASRAAAGGEICSTNHFRSEELKEVGWPLGRERYETLDEFLAKRRGSIDVEAMRGVLREVAKPSFLNVQSMVFLPARREVHLSVGGDVPVAERPFARIPREALFGDEPKPQ